MSCSKRIVFSKRRGRGDKYSEKEVVRHYPVLMPLLQWWRRWLSNLPFWQKGSKRGNCCSNYRVSRDWRIWRRRTPEIYLPLLRRENIKPEKQGGWIYESVPRICYEAKRRIGVRECKTGTQWRNRWQVTIRRTCSKKEQNIGQSCVTFFGREFSKHRPQFPQTMDI